MKFAESFPVFQDHSGEAFLAHMASPASPPGSKVLPIQKSLHQSPSFFLPLPNSIATLPASLFCLDEGIFHALFFPVVDSSRL